MLNEREAILMAHALGVHAEEGDLPEKFSSAPYRNRFSVPPGSEDDTIWRQLTDRKFAELTSTTHDRDNWYQVTTDGVRALRMFFARDALGAPVIAHHTYLIENVPNGPDNLSLWWKPAAHGYTARIHDAGVYSGWDAVAHAGNPERTDRIWPTSIVYEAAFKCITRDLLDDLQSGHHIIEGRRVPS